MLFQPIDIVADYKTCIANRRETYKISFGSTEGFGVFLDGYKSRMTQRMQTDKWFYEHLWIAEDAVKEVDVSDSSCEAQEQNHKIIGQFEYKDFSDKDSYGYIHLFYINQEYRGTGTAQIALQHIEQTLSKKGCRGVMLSVSSDNPRAVRFYEKMGFIHWQSNLKHALSAYYIKHFL